MKDVSRCCRRVGTVLIVFLTGSALVAQCTYEIEQLPEANGTNASGDHRYYLYTRFRSLVRYDVLTGDTLTLAPPDVPEPYSHHGGTSDIDDDGDRICYVGFNSEGEPGFLHVYDVPTGTVTTIFDEPTSVQYPSISGDGRFIFYYSDSPDLSLEIYRVEIATREVIPLTQVDAWSGNVLVEFYPVSPCFDGSCAAFDSRYREEILDEAYIAYWTEDTGYHQITQPFDGELYGAEILPSGDTVVFIAPLDLVPGQNAESSHEVFTYHVPTGTYRQMTKAFRQPLFMAKPAVSDDGRIITVYSDGDYNNEFDDRRLAVYAIDTLLDSHCVLAEGSINAHFPRINDRGDSIIFETEGLTYDARGGPTSVPVTTEIGLVILILGLMLFGGRILRARGDRHPEPR